MNPDIQGWPESYLEDMNLHVRHASEKSEVFPSDFSNSSAMDNELMKGYQAAVRAVVSGRISPETENPSNPVPLNRSRFVGALARLCRHWRRGPLTKIMYKSVVEMIWDFFKTTHPKSAMLTGGLLALNYKEDWKSGSTFKVDYAIVDKDSGKMCMVFMCLEATEGGERQVEDMKRKMVLALLAASRYNSRKEVSETVYGVLLLGPEYIVYECKLNEVVVRSILENAETPDGTPAVITAVDSIPEEKRTNFEIRSSLFIIWEEPWLDLISMAVVMAGRCD
ncbi:hypothetical protein BDR26DRAFT_861071 [Obelidium mucronatum]|nr:hypothetical protein BDR26DRAFT_861071 [Obelidium mucronatum]